MMGRRGNGKRHLVRWNLWETRSVTTHTCKNAGHGVRLTNELGKERMHFCFLELLF